MKYNGILVQTDEKTKSATTGLGVQVLKLLRTQTAAGDFWVLPGLPSSGNSVLVLRKISSHIERSQTRRKMCAYSNLQLGDRRCPLVRPSSPPPPYFRNHSENLDVCGGANP